MTAALLLALGVVFAGMCLRDWWRDRDGGSLLVGLVMLALTFLTTAFALGIASGAI